MKKKFGILVLSAFIVLAGTSCTVNVKGNNGKHKGQQKTEKHKGNNGNHNGQKKNGNGSKGNNGNKKK